MVQSELGMSQNLYLAQHFSDIDVMYSAHTHEVTLGALLAKGDTVTRTTPGGPLSGAELDQLNDGAAIVVETNRDMYVGRLDLTVSGGQIVDFQWEAIPTTGDGRSTDESSWSTGLKIRSSTVECARPAPHLHAGRLLYRIRTARRRHPFRMIAAIPRNTVCS